MSVPSSISVPVFLTAQMTNPRKQGDQRSMGFYSDDVQEVPADIRKLFENYSGIPSEDVVPHVLRIVSSSIDRSSLSWINTSHF